MGDVMDEDEMVQCASCTWNFALQGDDVEFTDGGNGKWLAICPGCGDLVDPDEGEGGL
jgi:hypothetical protein